MKANNKHRKLVEKALKLPGVKKDYDELEGAFSLLTTLVLARKTAEKDQVETVKAISH